MDAEEAELQRAIAESKALAEEKSKETEKADKILEEKVEKLEKQLVEK